MGADVVVEVAAVVELPPESIAMLWSGDLNGTDGVAYYSAAGNVAVDRRHDALAQTVGADGHSDLLQRIAPGFERLRPERRYYLPPDYVARSH
mmetsp:Transcript_27128/g.42601  ORF Transcript_27128/g.42601 Transcript_27128/m.42601 type:complete len:93 (-) Transcript_27128:72-350(-)